MFEAIKLRMFFAKVQAELKAQYSDQSFINRVCQLPQIMEQLAEIRKNAYYKDKKIAPFLNVCILLGEAMESDFLSVDDKTVCATLLAQRLQRAATDPYFRITHILLFDVLEQKILAWTHQDI